MWRKTPTKEQKQWLKDNGYTEKQIDAFWEDCRSTNRVINAISNSGGTWRDMSIFVLKELPTQKQRDLEYIKKKRRKNKKKRPVWQKLRQRRNIMKIILKRLFIVKFVTVNF